MFCRKNETVKVVLPTPQLSSHVFETSLQVRGRVSNELSVTAKLVFRDAEGQELGQGIDRACWLEHGGTSVDFDVGHSHCAVLVVVAGADKPIFVPYKTRVRANHRLTFVTETFKFDHPPATIELRLLSSRNELLLPAMLFDFLLADGVPSAVRCSRLN